jgi:ubiquinone/menaquinone biosynthesis C-methylase UbiE
MGLYKKYLLPKIIHWTCGQNPTMRQREKVVPLARGKVLEVGIGTGLNLGYYDSENVEHLTGLDPSKENWNMNNVSAESFGLDLSFVQASAEDIPADNDAFDSAIITYTLCSIPDPLISLHEIRRVLKPSGQLIFCEHGIAPDKNVEKWQHALNPIWRFISGGCNLNRNIPELLKSGGFKIKDLDTMYLPGWRAGSFNYWGTAMIR